MFFIRHWIPLSVTQQAFVGQLTADLLVRLPLFPLRPVAVNWLSPSFPALPHSSFPYSAPPLGSGSRPVEHEKQDRLDIKG